MTVVSNSSPLIYLAALSDFALPPAVNREVVVNGVGYPVETAMRAALNQWIRPGRPRAPLPTIPGYRLHAGETEVIALAREIAADAVLLDDRPAVRHARQLGLAVIPTPTIYLRAKHAGRIASVRGKLDRLRQAGFLAGGSALTPARQSEKMKSTLWTPAFNATPKSRRPLCRTKPSCSTRPITSSVC